MVEYWIDVGFACGGVTVQDGIIVDIMPILWKFKGQSWDNLRYWSKTVAYEELGQN